MPVKTGIGDLEAYTLRLRLDKCFVHLDTEDVRNLTNIVMEELQEYPGKIPVCSPSLSIDHDPILLIAVEPTDQQLCLGLKGEAPQAGDWYLIPGSHVKVWGTENKGLSIFAAGIQVQRAGEESFVLCGVGGHVVGF